MSFTDFDAITDPIMKAKMVALKGINKVMVQNNMGMTPMAMNRYKVHFGTFVFNNIECNTRSGSLRISFCYKLVKYQTILYNIVRIFKEMLL